MIIRTRLKFIPLISVIGVVLCLEGMVCSAQEDGQKVELTAKDGEIEVRIGGELFTRYLSTETKPILYPVLGPGQVPMTRGFPMEEKEGEANDHPHHQSIWLGHEVNGMDFWANRDGIIRHDLISELDRESAMFRARSVWLKREDESVVCTQLATYRFGGDERARWIDVDFRIDADRGDLTFDDTKEGVFAIRSHPDLRLSPDPKRGVEKVFGNAINSEGVSGKDVWGKSARWVSYWGQVDGKPVGFAIFDHPDNFRHPTHWHAREYGLVAANPFGLHHFTGAEKGAGAYTLKENESILFRYRVLFYSGKHKDANVNERFKKYAAQE